MRGHTHKVGLDGSPPRMRALRRGWRNEPLFAVEGGQSDEPLQHGAAAIHTALSTRICANVQGSGATLTLLCAATGYGKSTLLRLIAESARTVDTEVISVDCQSRQSLQARHLARAAITSGRGGKKTLILIDNAHLAPEFISADRLIAWAESNLNTRYIVASRTLPNLDWLSLQLSGKVQLFRAEDLRLTESEVAQLLSHSSGRAISPSVSARVHGATEGWPLAVQLCALKGKATADWGGALTAVSESNRELASHLHQAVLVGLSADLNAFLVSVAPFDRFSVALCEDVLRMANANSLIAAAREQNLFIEPAADTGWFRLHPIFRSYLVQRSPSSALMVKRTVLRAARDWFVTSGMDSEAIEYSIRIGDFDGAEEILVASASDCVTARGELAELIRWTSEIEKARGHLVLSLKLWRVWALIFSMRLIEAKSELSRLELLRPQLQQTEHDGALSMRLDQLRSSLAIRLDSISEARASALTWIDNYQTAPPFYKAVVAGSIALSSFFSGLETEHRRYLDVARRAAHEAGSAYANGWLSAIEVIIELECGHVRIARALAEDSVALARDAIGAASPIVASLSLLLARALCEEGRLEEAELHLAQGLQHFSDHGLTEIAIAGLQSIANTVAPRLGTAAALAAVRRLIRDGLTFAPRFELEAAQTVVMLLLRTGEYQVARHEFDQRIAPYIGADTGVTLDSPTQASIQTSCGIVKAALLLAEGYFEAALDVCNRLLPTVEAHGRARRVVELRVIKAAAHFGCGSTSMAMKVVSRAFAVAAERGYLQTMCNLGWALRDLIGPATTGAGPYKSFVADIEKRLGSQPPWAAEAVSFPNTDSLTQRELEILELLDGGSKNQAVAESLHLSLATVKWHLQNIYSKLAVSNRSGALSAVRRSGLLHGAQAHRMAQATGI